MGRQGMAHLVVQAQRAGNGRDRGRVAARVAACEQRDIVTALDLFLDKVEDNAFGSAVECRRDTLVEWSHMSDSHAIGWCKHVARVPALARHRFTPLRFRLSEDAAQ